MSIVTKIRIRISQASIAYPFLRTHQSKKAGKHNEIYW